MQNVNSITNTNDATAEATAITFFLRPCLPSAYTDMFTKKLSTK